MSTTLPDGDAPDIALRAPLARVLRAIFPHDDLADGPYERSADAILGAAASSVRLRTVLREGLRSLDGMLPGDLADTDVDTLGRVLGTVTQTEFFQTLLTSAVVTLYSDPETWEHLGYEGFSSDQGGYLHRGFDDLDWLPAARITEYDGPDGLVGYVSATGGTPDFGSHD